MKRFLFFILLMTCFSVFGQTPVRNFSVTDAATGQEVLLDQYAASGVVVILFTSNQCPFDQYYHDRLTSLLQEFSGKVKFMFVNSHVEEEESVANMKQTAAAWGLGVPYFADKNQSAMEALGAQRSPEAFVLKYDKSHFVVAYSGAIDDNPQEPGAVTVSYLKHALENVLAGKPVGHRTMRGAGCTIRKK